MTERVREALHGVCVLIMPTFEAGTQPPSGYLEWHEWARAQYKAGLRQRRCQDCLKWKFPQEKCCERLATTGREG